MRKAGVGSHLVFYHYFRLTSYSFLNFQPIPSQMLFIDFLFCAGFSLDEETFKALWYKYRLNGVNYDDFVAIRTKLQILKGNGKQCQHRYHSNNHTAACKCSWKSVCSSFRSCFSSFWGSSGEFAMWLQSCQLLLPAGEFSCVVST